MPAWPFTDRIPESPPQTTSPSRWMGATDSGAPVSGSWRKGDWVIANDGGVYICSISGTPGTWVQVGAQPPLAVVAYASGSNTSYSVSSTTMADVDATNLAITFTVPASGKVIISLNGQAFSSADGTWGLREASTVIASSLTTKGAAGYKYHVEFYLTGLTPGASKTYKWGALVTSGSMSIYHGPDNGQLIMKVVSA